MSMFVNLFKFIFVRSKRYKISIAKIEKDTFMNKNYLLRPNRKHINYVLHIRLKIDDVGDFRFSMNANPTVDGYLNIMPTSINIRYYFLMVFFNNLSLNPDFNAWLKKQYDSYLKGKFKSEIYFDSYNQKMPNIIPKDYKQANSQFEIQSLSSEMCGQLCVLFLYYLQKYKNPDKAIKEFYSKFRDVYPNF